MAIFSNLHTESGLKSLEEYLSGKTFISGDQLTKDDIKVYAAVLEKPDAALANASHWYNTVSSSLAERFPGKAAGVRICAETSSADATPVADSAKPEPAGDDDDDLDLFGEETEEEKRIEEARTAAYKASMKTKE
ncbi:Elongation factor 1-beta, partial [Thalictrum thalictroides]